MTDARIRFATDILRRLGEELNPSPDQSLLELVKNAYDADARSCKVELIDTQPSRRSWRTLVRVEDVDERFAYVVIPGWDVHEVVKLPKEDVGSKVRAALSPGVRVHAHVNIGAESQEELYFDRWEAE